MQPLSADEWGDDEYAAFGTLLGMAGARVPRAGSNHPYDPLKFPVVGMLARHPKLATAFLTFNAYLLQRGELPARLRELIILRVAYDHQLAFEWGQHVKMALAVGVTSTEIDRIPTGAAGFEGHDALVLSVTAELTGNATLSIVSWDHLVTELGEHQAMEVIFVVGAYITTGMAFSTWGLAPAAGTAPLPTSGARHGTSP